MANRREEYLNVTHARGLMARLERDAFPGLGAVPICELTAPEILKAIRAVEACGALDVSRRILQSIGQVFRYAIVNWERGRRTLVAIRPNRARFVA